MTSYSTRRIVTSRILLTKFIILIGFFKFITAHSKYCGDALLTYAVSFVVEETCSEIEKGLSVTLGYLGTPTSEWPAIHRSNSLQDCPLAYRSLGLDSKPIVRLQARAFSE